MIVYYILAVFCLISGLSAKTLPDFIPRCYRNDPNIDQCIINATETLRTRVTKNGIPELGIPVLEPYVVPLVSLEQAAKSLQFKMTLKNLTFTGLSTYKFKECHFDPETLTFNFINIFDKLYTTSQCYFEGKILIIPLSGQGTFLVSTKEPTLFDLQIKSRLVKIKGVDHLEITNITGDFPLVKINSRFENFDSIRPEIIQAINQVLEESSDEIVQEVLGTLQEFLYTFMKKIYSELFRRVPYNDLFPISDKFQKLL